MNCRSQSRTSYTFNFNRLSNTNATVLNDFVWDCGVCSLSCGECPLNSEKATAMIGCLIPVILHFNFNRHLPHVQVVTRDWDYGSSFPQSLALLWSVRQWTEVEAEYHHFARMGKCENSLDSLRMTRNAEISA